MTWKRVATAVVMVPVTVGVVLWGSTAIVAIAIALVTLLALFEYFALGEAIGHRAYPFWTATVWSGAPPPSSRWLKLCQRRGLVRAGFFSWPSR